MPASSQPAAASHSNPRSPTRSRRGPKVPTPRVPLGPGWGGYTPPATAHAACFVPNLAPTQFGPPPGAPRGLLGDPAWPLGQLPQGQNRRFAAKQPASSSQQRESGTLDHPHAAVAGPKYLPHEYPWGQHRWGTHHRRRLTRRALYRTWHPPILVLPSGPPGPLGGPAWPLRQLPQDENPRIAAKLQPAAQKYAYTTPASSGKVVGARTLGTYRKWSPTPRGA